MHLQFRIDARPAASSGAAGVLFRVCVESFHLSTRTLCRIPTRGLLATRGVPCQFRRRNRAESPCASTLAFLTGRGARPCFLRSADGVGTQLPSAPMCAGLVRRSKSLEAVLSREVGCEQGARSLRSGTSLGVLCERASPSDIADTFDCLRLRLGWTCFRNRATPPRQPLARSPCLHSAVVLATAAEHSAVYSYVRVHAPSGFDWAIGLPSVRCVRVRREFPLVPGNTSSDLRQLDPGSGCMLFWIAPLGASSHVVAADGQRR